MRGTTTARCYGSASGASIISGRFSIITTGTCTNLTVISGGFLFVSGSVLNATADSRGYIQTKSGGTVTEPTINSGGYLYASSGGTTNAPIINSGGCLIVSSGGTALLVTSNTGAVVTVEEGGYITYKE